MEAHRHTELDAGAKIDACVEWGGCSGWAGAVPVASDPRWGRPLHRRMAIEERDLASPSGASVVGANGSEHRTKGVPRAGASGADREARRPDGRTSCKSIINLFKCFYL